MFTKVALLSTFVGLAAAAALDVFVPHITSPTATSVWPVGSQQNVTWDTSNAPTHITNPNGEIVLVKNGLLDLNNPLATGFPILQGWQVVTVPNVDPGSYAIVLFGDSGNDSPIFQIV